MTDADAYIGEVLDGRYEIVSYLGTGNFSYVYKCLDQNSDSQMALKLLKPNADPLSEAKIEFAKEAQLLENLEPCRNVVNFIESGQSDIGLPLNDTIISFTLNFLVMELADGDLSQLLAHRHELPWTEKLSLFRDVVSGIHQMHLKKIVHRDLKSANVLLFDTEKRRATAKVSDLGRSHEVNQPPRFKPETYLKGRGDMSFAPPEFLWLLGGTDSDGYRRADIYLLGSVLFEFATAQGITGMAMPNWRNDIYRRYIMSEADRKNDFQASARMMSHFYEQPLDVLADELPPAIRHDGVNLIRQMCHPDPSRREHRFRAERSNPEWGLQWVLRRVDIMRKNLERKTA